jgi:rubrerythrin
MDANKSLEILKMAILMERKGYAFYKQVASSTKSEAVKEIFEIMANEEIMHEKFLSDTFRSIANNTTISELKLPEVNDKFVSQILTDKIKKEITAASYEAAAISAALDMESNAIKVYSEYAEKSTTQQEQELFKWLANWERTHYKVLLDIDKELKESIWYDNKFWPF